MHPIICQIGPFTIYSYGFMLAAAFMVSFVFVRLQAQRQGVDPQIIFNFLFLSFISGIIGARIFYIAENMAYYIESPLEILKLYHGGLSWFGGLIAGLICGILYLKKKNLPVYKTFDLVIPFLALAQAIGRIGCLLNGCCFGITPVPVQIYSSLILVLVFVILRFLQEAPHKDGQVFFSYLLLYSIKRFLVEFWRADNMIVFLGLSLFQILSVCLFFAALAGLCLIQKRKG